MRLAACAASACGSPSRTLQPPTGRPLAARNRLIQSRSACGSGLAESPRKTATQPKPSSRSTLPSHSGLESRSCQMKTPACSHDIGTAAGGGVVVVGGGGGAVVGGGGAAVVVGV